jgi:hypothetical protein
MKFVPALLGLLLLTACAPTVGSVKAVCDIPNPTFTEEELNLLSDYTLYGLDTYAERKYKACLKALKGAYNA